jgi:integrase/predicted RNA-binding Zn-ribbon protein involved in translation (DUF1610 family)
VPRRTSPFLHDAMVEYQANRADRVARSTWLNDQSVLDRFCRGVGNPRVHLLTREATEAWFLALAQEQQASSYNKVKSRVGGLLSFCQRRCWLTTDPLAEVRTRRQPKRERLHLDAAQLELLVEASANPRDRAILAAAVNTGLRAGDLSRLRVEDLDLDSGVLHTAIQKTASVDKMPVTADLDREMRVWLIWYGGELVRTLGRGIHGTDVLFPAMTPPVWRRTASGPLSMGLGDLQPDKQIYKPATIVQRALVRIGVRVTHQEGFHTIRRSVGELVFRRASELGYDSALRVTAAMLGHQSTQTTELYLDLSQDRQRRDELLRGQEFLRSHEAQVMALPLPASSAGSRARAQGASEARGYRSPLLAVVRPIERIVMTTTYVCDFCGFQGDSEEATKADQLQCPMCGEPVTGLEPPRDN